MTGAVNLHSTCLVVADRGVLISGPSGSGKSALALCLLQIAQARGVFARLVCDDQAMVSASSGRLVARAPRSISGLVEIAGLGIAATPHLDAAVIDLVVMLRLPDAVVRHPEPSTEILCGLDLPAIALPERNSPVSALAVLAALGSRSPSGDGNASLLAGYRLFSNRRGEF